MSESGRFRVGDRVVTHSRFKGTVVKVWPPCAETSTTWYGYSVQLGSIAEVDRARKLAEGAVSVSGKPLPPIAGLYPEDQLSPADPIEQLASIVGTAPWVVCDTRPFASSMSGVHAEMRCLLHNKVNTTTWSKWVTARCEDCGLEYEWRVLDEDEVITVLAGLADTPHEVEIRSPRVVVRRRPPLALAV